MAGANGKTIIGLFTIYSKKQDERLNTAAGQPRLGSWPNLDPGSLWLQLQCFWDAICWLDAVADLKTFSL